MQARNRIAGWAFGVVCAAATVAVGLTAPGDAVFMLAPLGFVPLVVVTCMTFEGRWNAASRRARLAVWFAAALVAVAGAAWYAVEQSDRAFVVGTLMAIPVLVVTPFLDRDPEPGDVPPTADAGPFGPP